MERGREGEREKKEKWTEGESKKGNNERGNEKGRERTKN